MNKMIFEKKFRILYRNLFYKFGLEHRDIFLNFIAENKNIIINHKYGENIINNIYKIKKLLNDTELNLLNNIFIDYYVLL